MLVLSRKNRESIIIITPNGEEITIVVSEISKYGTKVKIGIEAAKHFKVYRKEHLQDTGKS